MAGESGALGRPPEIGVQEGIVAMKPPGVGDVEEEHDQPAPADPQLDLGTAQDKDPTQAEVTRGDRRVAAPVPDESPQGQEERGLSSATAKAKAQKSSNNAAQKQAQPSAPDQTDENKGRVWVVGAIPGMRVVSVIVCCRPRGIVGSGNRSSEMWVVSSS